MAITRDHRAIVLVVAALVSTSVATAPDSRSDFSALQAYGTRSLGAGQTCTNPVWSGTPGTSTDVTLTSLSASATMWGCIGGCNGSSPNARVYFAPSASLINSGNADVPWLEWLGSGSAAPVPPYGNRQHPLLTWNLYRIDQDGRLEQIGRSGVKHAWFTVNSNCGCNGGNVLWSAANTPTSQGCSDTYSAANNNESRRLGPRSEIVPKDATWGRCGSVWDPSCSGVALDHGMGPPAHRMLVRESDLAPAANPGAQYFLEAWYLVRDDQNWADNMRHVRGISTWNGSSWTALNYVAGSHAAGPVIDTWVAPQATGMALNRNLQSSEGRARLAVRVTDLGDGRFRYDYALMNFDYARPQLQGSEPNLRVIHNRGFDRFAVPVAAGVVISDIEAVDGSGLLPAWIGTRSGDEVVWSASTLSGTLDWGTLLRFSFIADLEPLSASAQLHVQEAGTPGAYAIETLVPGILFSDGFE